MRVCMVKAEVLLFWLGKDKMIGCVYFLPSDSTYIHNINASSDY